MSPRLTLAVAQAHTQSSTGDTLRALEATVQRAASAGTDLILFPEAYLGGYPRGTDFGCSVGARTDTGREQFRSYFHEAVDLGDTPRGAGSRWIHRRIGRHDGDGNGDDDGNAAGSAEKHAEPSAARATAGVRGDGTREQLERIARETGVVLVIGLIERAGGSLYCAVVYVEPRRGCIGKRRKVMPTGTERLVWAQGSTATLRAVKTSIKGVEVTLAAAICWENYMPLLRASLYSQNVNIYLAPTADQRDSWLPLMRTVALESRAFVLSANQCLRQDALPAWINGGSTTDAANGDSPSLHRNLSDGSAPPSASPGQQRSRREARRNSVVTKTDDNHEITWPASDSKSPPPARDRKASITVPAGPHQVCLPSLPAQHAAPSATGTRSSGLDSTSRLAEQEGAPASKSPFVCRGGSCIVGPDGTVLAGPLWEDTHGLLTVQVDLDDCILGRLDFDCAGSYSRNDSFELRVKDLDLDPP